MSSHTPPLDSPAAAEELCVTCARGLTTPYCPRCGEKRSSDRSLTLRQFASDAVEALLSFDGRAIRTFKTLIRRPGELTVAYMRGSRLPYLAPLQCFLVFNLLYFLWATAAHDHVFDTRLYTHLNFMPYSGPATRAVMHRLLQNRESANAFVQQFDTVGTAQSKTLVLVMVPWLAAWTGLLTLGRRHRYAVQHLTFALHTFAFFFCLIPFMRYVVNIPLVWIFQKLHFNGNGELGYDLEVSLLQLLALGTYISLSLRRAYEMGRVRAIATAAGLGVVVIVGLQLYRALLFWVTFLSV